MTDPYNVGTVSVSNGSTTVTGSGTIWVGRVKKNDLFTDPAQGIFARVTADAVSNTSLSINAWPGTDMSGDAYEIIPGDGTENALRVRELLAQLSVIEANGRGLFYLFSNTTADADPGAGNLRINNADASLATALYIDNLDANGATATGELDAWDDSTSLTKGRLWLRSISDPSSFRVYRVTGSIVDGTGYRKATLVHVGGSGSFANADEIMVFFVPTGDIGDGYVTDATVANAAALTALESEAAGYRVFVTDLGTDFGAYTGRSGVVELVAGPDWELVAIYTGPQGTQGVQGDKGWSPKIVLVSDGARRVFRLEGYVGGAGTAPTANVGEYLKGDGTFTATIGDAADLRGAPGLNGAGTVAGIVAGDGITVDNTDPTQPVVTEARSIPFFSALALEVAEDRPGGPVMAGPEGNGIFDGFNVLTFVDEAGATNLDTSTAGVLKPAPTIVTLDSDGPFGSPVDFSAFTMGDMSWKLNNNQVVTKIGHYARANTNTIQMMIVKRNSAGNYDVVVSEAHSYTIGADGWTDRTLTTPFSVPASGDYYVAVKTTNVSASAIWAGTADRFYYSGTASGTGLTFTEGAGNRIGTRATQITGTSDVTVESEIISADIDPEWVMLFAAAKLDTAVLNTDFVISVTRDDADYQSLTLAESYARHDGSILYTSGKVDITSLDPGTDCRWRWTTANNKACELLAIGVIFGN